MFYERKIKYFDYIENGEKIRNAGFAKIEVRDEECNIDIQIKGVPIKETIKREISLNGYDKTSSLGELMLQDGEGSICLHKCDSMALGSNGLDYNELENIQITVDGARVIRCFWAPRSSKQIEKKDKIQVESKHMLEQEYKGENISNAEQKLQARHIPNVKDEKQEERNVRVEEKTQEEKKAKDEGLFHLKDKFRIERKNKAEDNLKNKEVLGAKNSVETQDNQNVEYTKEDKLPEIDWKPKTEVGSKEENADFREDKWSQIASIYPRICPFEDEREYLLIQPRDFLMLSGRSYPLVNNSFLLHGYYNYNHLVLARKQGRGEDIYYIGVPGNFYDREKQVAIMFGFESFECKEEPAGHGDYGYYMIRVDL